MQGGMSRRVRGTATVLAMIFLIVFAALAVGFMSTVTTSIAISSNEGDIHHARAAAESGLEYAKQVLAAQTLTNVTDSSLLTTLNTTLQGYFAAASSSVTTAVCTDTSGNSYIRLPSTGTISIDSSSGVGTSFYTTIWVDMVSGGNAKVRVNSYGCDAKAARVITESFIKSVRTVSGGAPYLEYGLFAGGKVTLSSGGTKFIGKNAFGKSAAKLMSLLPAKDSSGNAQTAISLQQCYFMDNSIYVTTSTSQVDTSNVGDTYLNGVERPYYPASAFNTWASTNIGVDTTPPSMPTFTTTDFASLTPNSTSQATATSQYITSSSVSCGYQSGSGTTKNLINCRVKAGSNTTFGGVTNIYGVLYIESPNKITFTGTTNVYGAIIFEKNTANASSDSVNIGGGVAWYSTPSSATQYVSNGGATVDLTATQMKNAGWGILAPTANLTLGSYSAIEVPGSIVGNTIAVNGGGGVTIDDGSLISLSTGTNSMVISGNATQIAFNRSSSSLSGPSYGVTSSSSAAVYLLDPSTYIEQSTAAMP